MKRRNLMPELALVAAILLSVGGCQSFGNNLVHHPIDLKEPEVLVRPVYAGFERGRLAVLYFFAPPYAAGAADVLTSAYSQELIRSGLFRQVAIVRQVTPENMNVLDVSSVPAKNYDLVMRGKIDYLMAGTGASPTQLTVEVQLIDTSRQMLLWYVKQKAISEPGSDVDMIWYTVPGKPAVSYQTLADALASQFAGMITPSEKDKQDIPVKSPFTSGKKAP